MSTPHTPALEMPRRVILLDGIRGIAALVVLFYHLDLPFLGELRRGYLMVGLFFMLSGFVMTLAYEQRLREGLSPARFILARYRRLLPVVWVGVAIGIASYIWLHDTNWGLRGWTMQVLMALFLIPTVWVNRDPALFPLNRAHWSLFFEIVANIAHALVLWRLGNRTILLLVVVFAACLAGSIFIIGNNGSGAFQGRWYFGFLRVGFNYCMGIWLARQWLARRPKGPLHWAVVLVLPIAILVSIENFPVWIGEIVCVMLLMPWVIWLGAAAYLPEQAQRPLVFLGALSYPLYATHGPLLAVIHSFGTTLGWKLLALVLSLAVAWATARVLERARLARTLAQAQADTRT